MATAGNVERQILKVEGFRVRIKHEDNRDLRSDKENLPWYDYENMAPGNKTVFWWRQNRFKSKYPGYEVDVFDTNGHMTIGQTRLSSIRDT